MKPGTCPECGSTEAEEWKTYWELENTVPPQLLMHIQCSDCGCDYVNAFSYRATWEEDDEHR
jgi:hypothetical protein